MSELNKSQDDAIKKAYDLLTEHFDNVLIVTNFEMEDKQEAHECWWYGGAMSAIGMSEYAKDRILNSGKKNSEPEEPS